MTGNLLDYTRDVIRHVDNSKVTFLLITAEEHEAGIANVLEDRFALIKKKAEIIKEQIEKIKQVAQEKNFNEILDIIKEEIKY